MGGSRKTNIIEEVSSLKKGWLGQFADLRGRAWQRREG